MLMPTVAKSYTYDTSAIAATPAALLRGIKDRLLAMGVPATVDYSSRGSAGNVGVKGDGVDRWTADSHLLWGTGNHSWFVLNLPTALGVGGNAPQLLFDTAYSSTLQINVLLSAGAGFTGGTISARPTATDEMSLQTNATNWCVSTGSMSVTRDVIQSTDGQ